MSTDATAGQTDGSTEAEHDDHEHGSVAGYIMIGVILAVVTFVEVAIFYMEAIETFEVPLLIILSLAKVVLVVMYFMHLKMDHRALTGLFMSGVVLAVFMVSALVVLYHFLPRFAYSP